MIPSALQDFNREGFARQRRAALIAMLRVFDELHG